MKMNSKKVFFVMIGIVILLSGAGIASVYVGNNLLQKKSAKLVELKLEDRLLEEQQVALVQANKDIQKYAELEKIAKSIVPQEKDQAKAVREIVQYADAAGVKLQSISFPSSTLGQAPPKPATTTGENTASTVRPASPSVTQVKPADGIPGVYSMEVAIHSVEKNATTYTGFLDFLSKLEQGRRTAQVSNINIKPAVGTNNVSFSLTVNVYIKP